MVRLLARAVSSTVLVALLVWPSGRAAAFQDSNVLCRIAPVGGGTAATAAAIVTAQATRVPAVEVRLALGRLLAEHTFLSMDAMRATALSGPDLAAITDGLDDNSSQLADMIGTVYGDAARAGFDRLWREHVTQLLAYARSVASGDAAGAAAAKQALTRYLADFVRFLADANPHISADHEAVALQQHVNQLLAFADADYQRAFAAGRDAYRHMFDMGDDLAQGIARQFPKRFPGAAVAFSPRSELRVLLGRLLAEHLVLSAEAMRAGVQQSADKPDAASALDANTEDLAVAFASLYGSDGGDAFREAWSPHVAAYLGYVDAIGRSDAAARDQSLATLRSYPAQIARFLSSANPKLDRAAVETMVQHHVEALINQADAFAAHDYRRSVTVVREAYRHMFDVADALAAAIAAQFPKQFSDRKELPATSTADDPTGLPTLVPLIAAVVFVVTLLLPRRFREPLRTRSSMAGSRDPHLRSD